MPYELLIPIRMAAAARPGLPEQRGMHAIFLAALQTADPALSQIVHDAFVKPFTQALLENDDRDKLTWRVTLLDDNLYGPFVAGLSSLNPGRLLNQKVHLDISAMQTHQRTYAELAETAAASRCDIRFHTPTTFKQSNRHLPIPDPYRCFQSWWSRWVYFAPPALTINIALLDIVQTHLAVSRFSLHSQAWSDGQRRLIGAVGKMQMVTLQPKKLEAHWWQEVATLAAFAPYCGTGHKTSQGLGQTSLAPGEAR